VTKRYLAVALFPLLGFGGSGALIAQEKPAQEKPALEKPAAHPPSDGGYILENDKDVASEQPGTHKGGGMTTGYSFFNKAPGLRMVFRKRALKPGSAIGYHLQKEDEIYYVLSGRGIMQMNGKEFPVGPGDAILTRPGASHGLKQTGQEDLVIIINYEQAPR
jgi:mannose-6-phosphate isomerase-like protein (cupin superfamily)